MIVNGAMGTAETGDPNGLSEDNDNVVFKFCRDYIRGICSRDSSCRFAHEIPPKSCLKVMFRFCHDFQNLRCFRYNCRFIHGSVEQQEHLYSTGYFPRDPRNPCRAAEMGICTNKECLFYHPPEANIDESIRNNKCLTLNRVPVQRDEDAPPEAKLRRVAYDENELDSQCLVSSVMCPNCDSMDHKIKLLYENISVLLKKVADLTEKNLQLTSMNEFLLEQSASVRSDQPCVITSRHCTSAPVSLATVSMTPVVSLGGPLPTLVPAAGTQNLTLAPAASRAQLLTPAPQILTVSTTQQLVGNSGALIVTSAGAQQLMQVSDSGTLMGGGQTVVAVTPAQLTLAQPTQQLISSGSPAVQQLVQQSAQQLVQPQQFAAQAQSVQHLAAQQSALAAQQSAQHLAAAQQSAQHLAAAQQSAQHLAAAQQSAQHLAAAQQSAQHLAAAQQSAQHLAAAQQSAQHLAVAQQSAQHLAAAQQSAQHLAAAQQSAQRLAAAQQSAHKLVSPAQQLVHQTSTQQITISSTSQPMALPNSQAQAITFPMISQSILPH